jgi:hypothetical protein
MFLILVALLLLVQRRDADTQLGDVVNNKFKLFEKLQYEPGSEKKGFHYYSDILWGVYDDDNRYLPTTSDEQLSDGSTDEDTSSTYLSTLNEIKINKNNSCIRNGSYCLDETIFFGGHGDIWKAHMIHNGIVSQNESFILKRMSIVKRPDILRCALREIYFGRMLFGRRSVARFVAYFVTRTDYWLVYRYEGMSLQALLYAITYSDGTLPYYPSYLTPLPYYPLHTISPYPSYLIFRHRLTQAIEYMEASPNY